MKNKDKFTVEDLLQQSVVEAVKKNLGSHMNEAYVAEPKAFRQVSDNVSQRTKDGHVELYKNYVTSLNNVVTQIDSIDKMDANPRHSNYRSAKLDETYNLNAKWLHELYFANCFDPDSQIYSDSLAYMRLAKEFGDFDRWQKDFSACALSAGEGWAICGYNLHLQKYVNTFISHHSSDVMIGLYPLIVIDMWSHAYVRDYSIDNESYLVSMLRELNWNIIEERFNIVEKLEKVLK